MSNKVIKEFIDECKDLIWQLGQQTGDGNQYQSNLCDKIERKLDEILHSLNDQDLAIALQWRHGYSKDNFPLKRTEMLQDLKIVRNRLLIMVGDEDDSPEAINLKDKIFISHSSKDVEFAKILADFLSKIGIKNVFCSSIEGQGVKNGKKIEEFVRNEIIEDKALVYIITNNFLASSYCAHELGAGWILRDKRLQDKSLHLLKLPDVEFKDIKGFVDGGDKMAELTEDGFMTFVAELEDLFDLTRKRPNEYKKLFDEFFLSIGEIIKNLKTKATQTKEEKAQELKDNQKKIISKLNVAEKRIIACMYFSDSRCITLDISKALPNVMERKALIGRGSTVNDTSGYELMDFSYFLQPWVVDYIDENQKFKKELKDLLEKLAVEHQGELEY